MGAEGTIVVSACKYDGAEHRRWSAQLVRREGPFLILEAQFTEAIDHDLLGTISVGTISVEYYWLDRWYNVFRFSEPTGKLLSYYCNINVPPSFDGRVLSYVDLDIDVLVKPDLSYEVLDLDDFEQNASRYGYPVEIRNNARQAVMQLIRLIDARAFPFDQQ